MQCTSVPRFWKVPAWRGSPQGMHQQPRGQHNDRRRLRRLGEQGGERPNAIGAFEQRLEGDKVQLIVGAIMVEIAAEVRLLQRQGA